MSAYLPARASEIACGRLERCSHDIRSDVHLSSRSKRDRKTCMQSQAPSQALPRADNYHFTGRGNQLDVALPPPLASAHHVALRAAARARQLKPLKQTVIFIKPLGNHKQSAVFDISAAMSSAIFGNVSSGTVLSGASLKPRAVPQSARRGASVVRNAIEPDQKVVPGDVLSCRFSVLSHNVFALGLRCTLCGPVRDPLSQRHQLRCG